MVGGKGSVICGGGGCCCGAPAAKVGRSSRNAFCVRCDNPASIARDCAMGSAYQGLQSGCSRMQKQKKEDK